MMTRLPLRAPPIGNQSDYAYFRQEWLCFGSHWVWSQGTIGPADGNCYSSLAATAIMGSDGIDLNLVFSSTINSFL
jgi:hypothetical protein